VALLRRSREDQIEDGWVDAMAASDPVTLALLLSMY
jgi:hypothetical protein